MSTILPFITKYKPYYVSDFDADPRMQSIINTLFEIDDLNVLFIGNTSCGKTTLLNAMIRQYYNFDKTDNLPETNIMFINNLKEQGVNYFRNEMRTFCQSHCSIHGKKKIIAIDDLDMINEQSQQVFRNYIDKYKHNIHFIFACTNVQKVIESLQSRLHIINIKPITNEKLEQSVAKIAIAEELILEQPALQYLVEKSNHSIRNALNNLEKLWIYCYGNREKNVSLPLCEKLCSTISFYQFEKYIQSLRSGKLHDATMILYEINDYGYSVIDILDYFYTFVKTTTMLSSDEKYKIIPHLCKYITIYHNNHEHCIELALFTNNVYSLFQ
jgi:DNA polymerase III delta prime subunit